MRTNFKSLLAIFSAVLMMAGTIGCKKEAGAPRPQNPIEEPANAAVPSLATAVNHTTFVSGDFAALANRLRDTLKNKVGASIIVSYNGAYKSSTSGGFSRMAQDGSSRAMTIFDRYSTGGVSATITTTALMKLISGKSEGLDFLSKPMWPYLPKHWSLGPNVKNVTFKDLVTQTSGLISTSNSYKDDYVSLRNLILNGVDLSMKGKKIYSPYNYALLRLMLPVLANYSIVQVDPLHPNTTTEIYQANQLAQAYKDYCRKVVFQKLGSCGGQVIDCVNNIEAYPSLFYNDGSAGDKGKVSPDMTLVAGFRGWVLSNAQVADFFRTLHFTETLIPKSYSNYMRYNLAGYPEAGFTKNGYGYFYQLGFERDQYSQINTLMIAFDDGIQMTVFVNSKEDYLLGKVVKIYNDWR